MKRKYIIIGSVVVLIVILCLSFVLIRENRRKNLIKTIANHYGEYVLVNVNANLYQKKNNEYQVIGKVKNKVIFPLSKRDKESEKYYQIKDTNFYVYYDDVEKVNDSTDINLYSKYKVLGEASADYINLYKDDKLIIKINDKVTLPVLRIHDNLYDVYYFGNIYSLKVEAVDFKEQDNGNIEAISVLYLKDDINDDNVEKLYKKLQEKGYQTIMLDDLKYWVAGEIKLPDNVVLLKKDTCDDNCQKVVSNYHFNINTDSKDIEFYDGDIQNKVGDNSYYQYVVDNDTSIERIDQMLQGIQLPKPIYNTGSGEQEIAVLNYHFFYSSALGESCNESICLDTAKFEEQLQYLKNNGYKTLTMKEFQKWMYGEIELPEKSVLLTIDDGAMGTGAHNGNKLIPLLEKYQLHATLFLITGWWDVNNYRSPYLDVQSHTHDMHTEGLCSNQTRGAQMLCSTKEQVLNDLKQSISVLNDNTSFCFPFYASNSVTIEALQETGFKIAFIGGNRRAKRSNNKYQIPRYVIYNSTTLSEFISMLG